MTPREAELTRQLEAVLRENALLRQKIDLLVKRVFGSTSERLAPGQLELLALSGTAPEIAAPVEKPAAPAVVRPQKERAPRLPEHLPVVDQAVPGPHVG